jgi:hypothetical protein
MEDYQEETVVEASVDAEQDSSESTETHESESSIDTSTADAPKADTNVGDAIKREVERREAQLRKQYEEKYAPVTKQNSYLEKAARLEGFSSIDDYLKALDQHEQRQQIEQESARMGMDPETYAQYFAPVNNELSQLRQEVQTFRQQQTDQQSEQQSREQWKSLYEAYPALANNSDFGETTKPDWFTPQMQEFVSAGYKPIHAYELAHKETLFRQKEQEVLANVTGRGAKQILPSTDQPNNMQFDPSNMSFDDIKKISERVQRGERITL